MNIQFVLGIVLIVMGIIIFGVTQFFLISWLRKFNSLWDESEINEEQR